MKIGFITLALGVLAVAASAALFPVLSNVPRFKLDSRSDEASLDVGLIVSVILNIILISILSWVLRGINFRLPVSNGTLNSQSTSAIATESPSNSGDGDEKSQHPLTDAIRDSQSDSADNSHGTFNTDVEDEQIRPSATDTSKERQPKSTTTANETPSADLDDKQADSPETAPEVPPTTTIASEQSRIGHTEGQLPATEIAQRLFSEPEVCLEIIRGATFSSDKTLRENQLPLIESRAIPNERLKRAFGIDNGFTTTDEKYRKTFRARAEKHISSFRKSGWDSVASHAQIIASEYAKKIAGQTKPSLDQIVQVVSLKVVFKIFFKLNTDKLEDETLLKIARLINRLWIQSKMSTERDEEGIQQLELYVKKLGLSWTETRDSPLNLLLPVYETLWRVVLRGLIEVAFRPSAELDWLDTMKVLLKELLSNPEVGDIFEKENEQQGISAMSLVQEALRLYPPTRRIYRKFQLASGEQQEEIAADIEACHRRRDIWGSDSDKFKPGRWRSTNPSVDSVGMKKAFMPFGGSPWICPASTFFAPRMIGVLIAAIAANISAQDWQLELAGQDDGSAYVLDEQTKLNSDRVEGNEWLLVKK